MTNKTFTKLLIVIAVLGVLFFVSQGNEERSISRGNAVLLSDINTDDIATVVLQRGANGEKAELRLRDGKWVIPARYDYPADMNKLRSFLLKLIELSVSQKVTDDPKNHEALGIGDNSPERGSVSLQTSGDKELATLVFGDNKRKGKGPAPVAGQFVRRVGQNEVYNLSTPIELTTNPALWIVADLFNVPISMVTRVTEEEVASGASKKMFQLTPNTYEKNKFELDLKAADNEEVDPTMVNSVAAGLENVRIADVQQEKSFLADKSFDRVTTYELSSGAVYKVESLVKDGKVYARYSVTYNPELAKRTEEEVKVRNEKNKTEFEESKKKAAEEKKPEAEKESKKPAEFVPEVAQIAKPEDIEKQSKNFSGWVYEIPNYQGEKYRRGRADLIKPKAAAEPIAQPDAVK